MYTLLRNLVYFYFNSEKMYILEGGEVYIFNLLLSGAYILFAISYPLEALPKKRKKGTYYLMGLFSLRTIKCALFSPKILRETPSLFFCKIQGLPSSAFYL